MGSGVAAGRAGSALAESPWGPSVCPRAEMGGGSSTRRVTFEADENENITVVKGVRLSDSVIDRMKEPSGRQHRGSVNDEDLKKRIAEELALERARRDSEAQKRRLKQEQMYVRDEFGKLLERERISSNEHLTRAMLRERAASEEERQKAQRFARQLEEKERELKKHDAFYKEQLARLEEREVKPCPGAVVSSDNILKTRESLATVGAEPEFWDVTPVQRGELHQHFLTLFVAQIQALARLGHRNDKFE
uniref:Coiled-coil-helix-coiled-coil-helix domain containing 3 n=1 Tax=Ficedula albicollis TaxID=59894 RepID=A0A803V1E5_FICAL